MYQCSVCALIRHLGIKGSYLPLCKDTDTLLNTNLTNLQGIFW